MSGLADLFFPPTPSSEPYAATARVDRISENNGGGESQVLTAADSVLHAMLAAGADQLLREVDKTEIGQRAYQQAKRNYLMDTLKSPWVIIGIVAVIVLLGFGAGRVFR